MKESFCWRPLLVVAIAYILLFVSCDKGVKTDGSGHSFSGFVTDSVSGTPIDSARICSGDTILGPFWYSDSTGYYTAASLGSRITVFVQKAGYGTKSRVLVLVGDPTDIYFKLVQE